MTTTYTTYHYCQNLRGALKNWDAQRWKAVARDNGMTPAQVKKQFELWIFEGKRVIPIGDPCEGFSYETGCPGHPAEAP